MPLSTAIGRPTKKTLLVEEKLGPLDEKLNIFPTWDLSKSVKNYKMCSKSGGKLLTNGELTRQRNGSIKLLNQELRYLIRIEFDENQEYFESYFLL
ncbi:hypothetical protein Bca4012_074121 [Brassica carinata]